MPAFLNDTLTFLFTDVEGSTALWEKQAEAMRLALHRQEEFTGQAIARHGGLIFGNPGDAYCVVFASPLAALNAALDAQIALHSAAWPAEIGALRVRMALHAGTAEERNGNYFGRDVNRVARLLAIGHGGQILLSETAGELIRDSLPPSVTLQDMGMHRLRDMLYPERIFQARHPLLPVVSVPLASQPVGMHNLPLPMNAFIGQEIALTAIKSLLSGARLLTLVGSGGCGKTRLSHQTAADVLEEFPDGVWLVELAAIAEPALVARTVAGVLHVRENTGENLVETLIGHLRAKHLLLILDNCEHLLEACAQLASALLPHCPHVKILASSREPLRIAGEQTYRIPSLSLPAPGQPVTPENVADFAAMRLFVERGLQSKADFRVTPEDIPFLTAICRRLDGIPLAIELAAARVRALSLAEINGRLDDCFRLLTGGNRTALPRQQTLRALIDWSDALLDAEERTLLRRLSVFSGGWTHEAAERVGADVPNAFALPEWYGGQEPDEQEAVTPKTEHTSIEHISIDVCSDVCLIKREDVFDLLSGLADKSLILVETQKDKTRFQMLETVRQYGREKLRASGESARVRARHCAYFLAFAEDAYPNLYGPEQGEWFGALEAEHDNMRAALTWCQEAGAGEAGLRLVGALGRFWDTRGYLHEGQERLARALAGAQEPTPYRAKALLKAGWIAYLLHQHAFAQTCYEEALSIYQARDDQEGAASALHLLAMLARAVGHLDTARQLFEQILDIHSRTGGHDGSVWSNLGWIAHRQGNIPEARRLLTRALLIYRQDGHVQHIASTLRGLGRYALEDGQRTAARDYLVESLRLFQSIGAKVDLLPTLEDFAGLARAAGQWERAGQLGGAAEALYAVLNLPRPLDDKSAAQGRQVEDAQGFAAAWAQGRRLTLEQAVALALDND